jgi:spore coat protein A, manganese oxidase
MKRYLLSHTKGSVISVCALGVVASGVSAVLAWGCSSAGPAGPEAVGSAKSAVGSPSLAEQDLDPTTVPKFAQQLPIPMVWTGTPVTSGGKTVQENYSLAVAQANQQMLPPVPPIGPNAQMTTALPATVVIGYQGSAHVKGSTTSSTITVTPGASFENTLGIPSQITWVDNIQQPAFLEVDPTLHWANPLSMQVPTPCLTCTFPFNLFPPGYTNSLFPVAHVTHTHGLVVAPDQDGTAEEWFTPGLTYLGPSYATSVYLQPNQQSPTQLFYHDHVMGVTRIGLYSGVVGTADFIRDPVNTPLDEPSSPLPTGQFEVPLALTARAFYTDGNLDFPPDQGNPNPREGLNSANANDENGGDSPPNQPYWSYNEPSDTIAVNGAVWPNLNVEPRQYRFRMLAGANAQLFDAQLCVGDWNASNNIAAGTNTLVGISGDGNSAACGQYEADGVTVIPGTIHPITVIGSDGGYLPAPIVANDVQIGLTERADILVDFSTFKAGQKIAMINLVGHAGNPQGSTEVIMQFTVQSGTPVTPPTLSASLFPKRPTLTANAPTRTKVLRSFEDDDPLSPTFNKRAIDGLDFDSPPTEFALVGSTEEWDLLNLFPGGPTGPFAGDSDLNTHQIHIHLLEFQLLNRQMFDAADYGEQWALYNGHNPVSTPIVVPYSSYLMGSVIPPLPVETGWKDTIEAPSGEVTRILVRWAPQATAAGGVSPGENQFPIDPTSFPDPIAGPGYVWHCHLVGHEDHDMMRELVVVNSWAAGVSYKVGTVVAFDNADYRVTTAHTSVAGQTPNLEFGLWDLVNTNSVTQGNWMPQIRYAVNDRVLYNGLIYSALSVFQSQTGQFPPNNPSLWKTIPMTACAQLAQFCQGNALPEAQACLAAGQAGDESVCLGQIGNGFQGATQNDAGVEFAPGLSQCLSDCLATTLATPCSGLCNNPTVITVAGNSNFQSGNLGTAPACFETQSRIAGGEDSSFLSTAQITVNGRVQNLNMDWKAPLPPMRHNGYCIQTSGTNNSFAAFSVWGGAGPN